jgi:glycosyltransferase involved in cell wall biosynthesis
MSQSPRISVLLPVYNSEKYVGEAIASILAQTFADFELIIINDGSTDNTAAVVRKYADPRLRFIDNPQNQGLIAVLNQGLDLCTGEYIARMDSDDISLPERLAQQLAFMEAHPAVGVLGTQIEGFPQPKSMRQPEKVGAVDLLERCCVWHPTVILRRDIFIRYQLRYDPRFVATEDYELWSRAVRVTQIANLPVVLLRYRWHEAQICATQRQTQRKNDALVKQNILTFLTHDPARQKQLKQLASGKRWRGIPLLKISTKPHKTIWRLFGLLPIWWRRKGS